MPIIDALESAGGLVLVQTGDLAKTHHKKQNALLSAETGDMLAAWTGAGIEAACVCGESVVCACLDGIIYIVEAGRVETVKLDVPDIWPTAGIEFRPGVALFTGLHGKLVHVDVAARTARVAALKNFDVAKPGRDIDGAVPIEPGRCWLLGKREMVLLYDGQGCETLSSTRSEIRFHCGANFDDALWIVATEGLEQKLACFKDGQLSYFESPIAPRPYTPAFSTSDQGLIIGKADVFAGTPGRWRVIGTVADASIIQLVPRSDEVIAVTDTGESVRMRLYN
jgi:hypothetical protein